MCFFKKKKNKNIAQEIYQKRLKESSNNSKLNNNKDYYSLLNDIENFKEHLDTNSKQSLFDTDNNSTKNNTNNKSNYIENNSNNKNKSTAKSANNTDYFSSLFSSNDNKDNSSNNSKEKDTKSTGLFSSLFSSNNNKDTNSSNNKIFNILLKSGISKTDINFSINKPELNYSTYYIAKKSGGKRKICKPVASLNKIQRALLTIIKQPNVSEFCSAYEIGSSIKANAEKHKRGKFILHLDIENFFPSINFSMFKKVYEKFLNNEEVEMLWKLVSKDNGLPIGTCTSPFIANRIMKEIDEKMQALSFNYLYSRYADDLIFSSQNYMDYSFIDSVSAILQNEGFNVNAKKTYFMNNRKEVTGLIITDRGKLSVGTSYKKNLKKSIYNFLTKGIGDLKVIKGKLSHLEFIEPYYAVHIKRKYSHLDEVGLLK